jgi:hypothetical protein
VNAGGNFPDGYNDSWIIDGRLYTGGRDPSQSGASMDVSQLTGPQGQSAFEPVESQMIEVVGDPSEQIEEELRLEEGVTPEACTKEKEDQGLCAK